MIIDFPKPYNPSVEAALCDYKNARHQFSAESSLFYKKHHLTSEKMIASADRKEISRIYLDFARRAKEISYDR